MEHLCCHEVLYYWNVRCPCPRCEATRNKCDGCCPGGFRTEFNKAESLIIAAAKIEDYSALHEVFEQFGKQLGDPVKAAEVFIELVESPNPPTRLLLGTDAYQRASAKLNELREELEQNKDISVKTDTD